MNEALPLLQVRILNVRQRSHSAHQDQNCRFVILSNGNLHYFWDLDQQALVAANRELITRFEMNIQSTLSRIWGETETHEHA